VEKITVLTDWAGKVEEGASFWTFLKQAWKEPCGNEVTEDGYLLEPELNWMDDASTTQQVERLIKVARLFI
jgi:hypothetical protein